MYHAVASTHLHPEQSNTIIRTGVLYWLLHAKFVENKLTVDNTTYHVL